MAVKLLKRVNQADFIGAYLQAKATGIFFVRLPDIYKQHFPTMPKYFGKSLRLRKTIYDLTLSGKLWKTWLRLIFYVDDMLYFGSNEQVKKDFEKSIKADFTVNFKAMHTGFSR
eukprot:5033745-Ditylum_brightwellii.AAC.1